MKEVEEWGVLVAAPLVGTFGERAVVCHVEGWT